MRSTPCESTPRRLAHTSDLAHSSALAGAPPAAAKSALAKRWRSALEITCNSVFDVMPEATANPTNEYRKRSLYERAAPQQSCCRAHAHDLCNVGLSIRRGRGTMLLRARARQNRVKDA